MHPTALRASFARACAAGDARRYMPNKLNVKHINGGQLKSKYSLNLIFILFLFVLITSCKEEAIVEQKKENNAAQSTLAKGSDLLSVQGDSTIQKEKKERVKRLKKEHEKPFVVIDKPEQILLRKLREKYSTNSKLGKLNGTNTYSAQSVSSITMEVDVWSFVKYHNSTGFIVGIWPKIDWMTNNQYISLLRNTYGFSHFFTVHDYIPIAESNGYSLSNIIAGVGGLYPQQVINSYEQPGTRGPCGFYYVDEPAHVTNPFHSSIDSVRKLVNYFKGKYLTQNPSIVVGETTVEYANNFDEIVDYVNCSWYGYYFWPLTNDQRSRWTDFNNTFGSKFNHLWISGELDRGEMDQLIGHARNMNKNSVWLYAAEMGMSNESYWDAIYEFTYYAFTHSFLRREERHYIYVYLYNDTGDPSEITSWDLIDIIDTGETRILTY